MCSDSLKQRILEERKEKDWKPFIEKAIAEAKLNLENLELKVKDEETKEADKDIDQKVDDEISEFKEVTRNN